MNELVIDGIKLSKLEIKTGFINGLPKKWLCFCQSLRNANHVRDSELASLFGKLKTFKIVQMMKSIQEATSVPSYSLLFQNNTQPKFISSSQQHKPKLSLKKEFEAKYNKVKDKLALLSSGTSTSKSSQVRNQGLVAQAYEWDEEEVSSDDNEMVELKVLMALADDESGVVGKESVRNGEWVMISLRKVHTLLEIDDNDERKSFLDYLCVDLNFVEEQINNLVIKHRDIVQELNTCKEQLFELKHAKLDFLTMHHVNNDILKENQNLRKELEELTEITKTWLNSSNKVNQCISEQIPNQKRKILGVDQLTKDPSSSGKKDKVFVKLKDSIFIIMILVEFFLPNHNTPLPPLEKMAGVKPISRPKTIKSILKSSPTVKTDTLKGVIINEPTNSSSPTKGNKNVSVSKKSSASAGKLKNVKIKNDIPLSVVMKELNNLKLQINKNDIPLSAYSRNNKPQHVPLNSLQTKYKTQFKKSYELCGMNNHVFENGYKVLFCKKCERTDHKTCDHVEYISFMNIS
ncbi:hypothetical protein Tco_0692920 [Tanacetum coccineum]